MEWKGLVEEKEGSGRRGLLWCSVNVEVALNNTRPCCLRPPAEDFLTVTLSPANYVFWEKIVPAHSQSSVMVSDVVSGFCKPLTQFSLL